MSNKEKTLDPDIIWQDKKRPFFGLPLSFTTYTLYKDRLYTTVKFLSVHEDEVRLYRIFDITLTRSLFERLFGVGTITCHSADVSAPVLEIKNIKNSEKVRTQLSELVEAYRDEKNITAGEFLTPNRIPPRM